MGFKKEYQYAIITDSNQSVQPVVEGEGIVWPETEGTGVVSDSSLDQSNLIERKRSVK